MLTQHAKQRHEQVIQPMQSSTKLALAQHGANVALFLQHLPCSLMLAAEEQRRHYRCRHHFGITHLALGVFLMMQGNQQIGAQAVNEYNLDVHEFSP